MKSFFVLLASLFLHPAIAQPAWPTKPVRLIAPSGAGTFTDLAARAFAAELSAQLGQQVVVENRAGAGTTIGVALAAKSPADGYTILMTDSSIAIAPALYGNKLPFDPLKDLDYVSLLVITPSVLWTRTGLPVTSPKDLVALAHARPGELSFGTAGQGSLVHLAGEVFFDKTGMKVIHVPFKGMAAALGEVIANRVDFAISSISITIGPVKAGQIRALAVTGKERNPLLPEVPTFAEAGFPDYDEPIWWGMSFPAGTPMPIRERLHAELMRAVAKPKLAEFLAARAALVTTSTPEEFRARIEREISKWNKIIPKAGVKAE
jgi:tripartite-type tricarboxylate transporter receptor subunit TctC